NAIRAEGDGASYIASRPSKLLYQVLGLGRVTKARKNTNVASTSNAPQDQGEGQRAVGTTTPSSLAPVGIEYRWKAGQLKDLHAEVTSELGFNANCGIRLKDQKALTKTMLECLRMVKMDKYHYFKRQGLAHEIGCSVES
ncbi:hypothetical protein HAX54_004795, partial [Datura stramonium]|nr:hypothetical protein [Datura stramonium]